jgi:hypothetical protein
VSLAQVSNNPPITSGQVTMAGFEPGTGRVGCAAPAKYVIGQNADSLAGMWFTFDAPTVTNRRWINAINARLSTCRFKFDGSNDDNSAGAATATAVNCGTLTGACRRCHLLGPCLCDRMTQAQQDFTVFFKYLWQDNNNTPLFDESAEMTSTIRVTQAGKPGCPIDWALPASPLQQMSQIPPFVQGP